MKIPATLRWKSTGTTLGQGGQAAVVQVHDGRDEYAGDYALKGLAKGKPAKAYERFAREIEAIQRLHDPSIIRIVDHSQPSDDFQFYVMEFVEGATPLKRLLNSTENPFAARPLAAVALFTQLIHAISVWSEAGIVHRDLSPANVLILPDNKLKVIDFGICQLDDHNTITLADEGVGTPNYMAPECESGTAAEPTFAADLYSAGKILWSAIANSNAFSRETSAFNAKSMARLFPELPEAWHLHHIFEKTIRHSPADRTTVKEALAVARRVRFLIMSGFPPLELMQEGCPVCGVGQLGRGEGLHSVFGNPNPRGIYSYQCSYCGMCFAINREVSKAVLQQRSNLV